VSSGIVTGSASLLLICIECAPALGLHNAKELVDRLADAGMPNLDAAIEHGLPISFATTRLTALVHNAAPGAVAYLEIPDMVGLLAWVLRDQLLAKIDAGFDEIADDKLALNQAQREEISAQISADSLAAERAECALIWHAAERGEVIDFRPTTSPQGVLGVSVRTLSPKHPARRRGFRGRCGVDGHRPRRNQRLFRSVAQGRGGYLRNHLGPPPTKGTAPYALRLPRLRTATSIASGTTVLIERTTTPMRAAAHVLLEGYLT
jgi:hypothetical protein